jgi:hypothetical protein
MEDRDLAFRMWDFPYYTHNVKISQSRAFAKCCSSSWRS